MDKKMSQKLKKLLPRFLFVLGIAIVVVVVLFGGIKANDYWQVNKLVKAADNFTKQEMYQEANNSLVLAQSRWTIPKIEKEIKAKIITDKQLISDKDNYIVGGSFFIQSKWQEAKDSYLKISVNYPHYKETQDKIKECESKIDEANVLAEQEAKNKAATTSTTTVTNDPFPVHPGYGECEGLETWSNEAIQCSWQVNNKYRAAREEWYARHGQTSPESQTTSPSQSSCRWVLNNWVCNYN
jgi:hypothetical protein